MDSSFLGSLNSEDKVIGWTLVAGPTYLDHLFSGVANDGQVNTKCECYLTLCEIQFSEVQ